MLCCDWLKRCMTPHNPPPPHMWALPFPEPDECFVFMICWQQQSSGLSAGQSKCLSLGKPLQHQNRSNVEGEKTKNIAIYLFWFLAKKSPLLRLKTDSNSTSPPLYWLIMKLLEIAVLWLAKTLHDTTQPPSPSHVSPAFSRARRMFCFHDLLTTTKFWTVRRTKQVSVCRETAAASK